MAEQTLYNLTCGPMGGTFEQALASVQDYGFPQTVFEVEALSAGKRARDAMVAGAVSVLRPSAMQAAYPDIKPGDRVSCSGMGRDAAGDVGLYRIRRMAEGYSRKTMTEHTK